MQYDTLLLILSQLYMKYCYLQKVDRSQIELLASLRIYQKQSYNFPWHFISGLKPYGIYTVLAAQWLNWHTISVRGIVEVFSILKNPSK